MLGTSPAVAVQVVSRTWTRDAHDLFDFEASDVQAEAFTVQASATYIRSGSRVQLAGDEKEEICDFGGTDMLARIVERAGGYWVERPLTSTSSKNLWVIIRDVAPAGYVLREHDIIKLGRYKFRIRQLVGTGQESVPPMLNDSEPSVCCPISSDDGLESRCCRICLSDECSEDDPFIAPCSCKGSIKYVHLGCLRKWTSSLLSLGDSSSDSYFVRPLSCELCKAHYPMDFCKGSMRSPLIELPRMQPPYVVLERSTRNGRGMHIVSLAESCLVIGRGHESGVRVPDVTISRSHATIRYEGGQFLLQDQASKFGTLVAMRRPQEIQALRPLSLQIGRTVLTMSLTSGSIPVAMPGLAHRQGAHPEQCQLQPQLPHQQPWRREEAAVQQQSHLDWQHLFELSQEERPVSPSAEEVPLCLRLTCEQVTSSC